MSPQHASALNAAHLIIKQCTAGHDLLSRIQQITGSTIFSKFLYLAWILLLAKSTNQQNPLNVEPSATNL